MKSDYTGQTLEAGLNGLGQDMKMTLQFMK